MSVMNNRQTLEHYMGKVWLTKPKLFSADKGERQGINVCVEVDDDFTAIDHIKLAPDGVYYQKEKALGRLDDDAFRSYIEKLAGTNGKSEGEFFQQVCDCYTACGDMGAVGQALGVSKDRVKRILISKGAFTDDLITKIAWLYDGGKGKTVAQIAGMLQMSENKVLRNMAYGE